MELREALILRMSFNDVCGEIRVDENGYICLNDLAVYYPHRRIDVWKKTDQTKEFIETVNKFLNTTKKCDLKSIISKRGKYNGGTYAHELVAMDFCTWLSPEFKLKVYLEYMEGRQNKKGWNIKRILAAYNYKIMSKAVEEDHDPVKEYHYGNEAKMINVIIFGMHQKGMRDIATIEQLDSIAELEGYNAAYIKAGMSYQDRKELLTKLYIPKTKQIESDL